MECIGTMGSQNYDCGIQQKQSMNEQIRISLSYLKTNTRKALKLLIKQYHVIDISQFEEHLCDGYASEIKRKIEIKYVDNQNTIFIWTIENNEFLW